MLCVLVIISLSVVNEKKEVITFASSKHQGTLLYPEVPVPNFEEMGFFHQEDKIVLLPIPENNCQVLSFCLVLS